MKNIILQIVGLSLITQFIFAQSGTFDFQTAGNHGGLMVQTVAGITMSISGAIPEVKDWGSWGGTTGLAYDNLMDATSTLILQFSTSVNISSIRLADAYHNGSSVTYFLIPFPNTGTMTATVPAYGGVTVNLGTSFQNIQSMDISLGGTSGYFVFDDIVFSLPVLPVEISSFTAKIVNNASTLIWSTATEKNNYGFELERRKTSEPEGQKSNEHTQELQVSSAQWFNIGFVQGHGTSNSPNIYSFTDTKLAPGKYDYRLKQINNDGTFTFSNETEVTIALPMCYLLNQNYPNPFNPTTMIAYQLPVAGQVTIKLFDVIGREVATLVNESKEAGSYQVTLNASDLPSGVYFYRLNGGSYSSVKKLLLMK